MALDETNDTIAPVVEDPNISQLKDVSIIDPLELEDAHTAPPRTKLRLTAILVALYLALFVAALDQTVVATAIPVISSELHSSSGYYWIGSAYLLANAAAGPLWAKCSDIWGRKPAILVSVVGFAASSILAALSVNINMLIAARVLQGVAGGGVMGLVTITISDLFSVRRRSLFLGLTETMWALAGGLGPIVGGAFTQLVTWRWCFWINLPVSGVSFIILLLFLDVHNPRTPIRDGLKAIDWFGTISIVGVTVMLLLGLDFGGATFPWSSPKVICLIIFGTLMIGLFLFSEKRLAKYPLVPLSIFKSWSNNAALAAAFCHGMAFIAAEYYLPLYLQSVKGLSPLLSGVLILPLDLTEASMGLLAGILIHRTGRFREILWFGMTLLTLGTGLYILLGRRTPLSQVAGFEIIEGVGSGALFQAPMIAIQAMVSQADTASAIATVNFVRNMAAAISIVIGGVVFQNGINPQIPKLRAAGLNNTLLAAFSEGKAAANVVLIQTIENEQQRTVVQDAFAASLKDMFIMYTAVAGAGLIASLFIVHKTLRTEHTETRTGISELTQRQEKNTTDAVR